MKRAAIGPRRARSASEIWVSVTNRARIARRERLSPEPPTARERLDELVRFYERYEELVETICDSAQYGPTPKLQRNYAAHREWLHDSYPDLSPFLGAFLKNEAEDGDFCEAATGQRADAFYALVAPEDLGKFLQLDDGGMISRITRTREALSLYGEHLRQLANRSA